MNVQSSEREESLVHRIVACDHRIAEMKQEITLWKMKRRHAHGNDEYQRIQSIIDQLKAGIESEKEIREAARLMFMETEVSNRSLASLEPNPA